MRRRRAFIRPRVESLEIRALLTVPSVIGLQTLDAPAGQVKIALEFSEAMQASAAGDPSNYFLAPDAGAGLRVTAVSYDGSLDTVTLTAQPVAGQSLASVTYRVRVDGHDLKSALGVPMAAPGDSAAVLVDDRNAIVTVGEIGAGGVGIESTSSLGYSPPLSFAAADFNGDGVIDLVTANQGSFVYLQGLGGGNFADPVSYDLNDRFAGIKVIAADWNSDGKADVILSASKSYDDEIDIFLNDGKGHFTLAPDAPFAVSPTSAYSSTQQVSGTIDVANVLPGGGPEILAYQQGYFNNYSGLNPEEGKIQILGKDPFLGYNRIMTVDLGAAMHPSQILHGDFNGDGRDDIVTGDITGVYVVMTTPTGLAPARKLAFDGYYSGTLKVGDVNGDGKLDIVDLHDDFSNNNGVADGDIISVFLGDGKGNFTNLPGQIKGGRFSDLAGLADFDADGKLDLLLTEGTAAWVWRGDGKGGFIQPIGVPTILYPNPYGLSVFALGASGVADINGDGRPDALFSTNGTGRIYVLNGDGAGGLVAPTVADPYLGTSTPGVGGIAIADFNGDGLPDLVKAADTTIGLSLGGADGRFHPFEFLALAGSGDSTAAGFNAGDLNNDGIPDLVVGHGMDVFLGRGDGTFSAAITYAVAGSNVVNFRLADVNNDGKLDAVVLQNPGADGSYAVYFGDGTGKLFYNPNTVIPRFDGGYQAVYNSVFNVGDYDGDGRLDILDQSLTYAGLRLLHGNGNGTFTARPDFDPGLPATTFFNGDLNGDGKIDAIGVMHGGSFDSAVAVYLNDGLGHIVASGDPLINMIVHGVSLIDLNGDGSLDLVISGLTSQYGPNPYTPIIQVEFNDGLGHFSAAPAPNVSSTNFLDVVSYNAHGTILAGSFPLSVPSFVQFAAASNDAAESASSSTITVTRSGDTSGIATVAYTTSDGTGHAGTNYSTASGTLPFAAGETSKTFAVPIVRDHLVSGPLTVILTLSNPSWASLGTIASATLTIADADLGGAIAFSTASYRVNAADGHATITVSRTGGDAGAVTVLYATANGSALSGGDYTAASGTLTFATGELSRSFDVPLLTGGATTDRTVNLTLSLPTGGGSLGASASSILTIAPFAAPVAPSFGFVSSLYEGNDHAGDIVVSVKRNGSTTGTDSVHYSIAPRTATAGVDYTDASGTLTFAPAESVKTFLLHRLDNRASTGDLNATLLLSSPSAGASLESPAVSILVIHDTDPAPVPTTLEFGQSNFPFGEKAGGGSVSVLRSGSLSAAVTVDYLVFAGTATPGADFIPGSGRLSFAAGEWIKTIRVPIIDDSLVEDPETVFVSLSSPSGPGAGLGTTTTATLTIISDDVVKPDPGPPLDTAAPRVIAIAVGGSGKSKINDILIRFSEGLDTASALDLTHYSLQPNGKGAKPVKIQGATYDASIQTVTLHLSASLTTAQAQLLSVQGMRDVAGNVLDGDRDGMPGGRAFTYSFSSKKSILDQITTGTITDPWGPSKPKFKVNPVAKMAALKPSYTVSKLKVTKVDTAFFNAVYDKGAATNSATQVFGGAYPMGVIPGAILEFLPNGTFRLTGGGGALLISNGSWGKTKGGVDFRGNFSSASVGGTVDIRIVGHLDLTAKGGPSATISYADHRGSALPPFDFNYAIEGTLSLS